jgi:DNA-binding response OmpR family regulator
MGDRAGSGASMPQYRLLAVDDDSDCADLIVRTAIKCGYEALPITDAATVEATVAQWRPDVLTLDIGMPNVDGLEVLNGLVKGSFKGHVVIISGKPSWFRKQVAHLGHMNGLTIAANIEKPFDLEELRKLLLTIGEGLRLRSVYAARDQHYRRPAESGLGSAWPKGKLT